MLGVLTRHPVVQRRTNVSSREELNRMGCGLASRLGIHVLRTCCIELLVSIPITRRRQDRGWNHHTAPLRCTRWSNCLLRHDDSRSVSFVAHAFIGTRWRFVCHVTGCCTCVLLAFPRRSVCEDGRDSWTNLVQFWRLGQFQHQRSNGRQIQVRYVISHSSVNG